MARTRPRDPSVRDELALVERLCYGVGLFFLLAYLFARVDGTLGQRAALDRFESARSGALASGQAGGPGSGSSAAGAVDFALWSPKRVALYEESLSQSAEIPIATLEIPRLGLRVAVLDGTDEARLNRGVGRIPGTARPGAPGNLAIAGHRDGFFRVLKDAVVGDSLRLDTVEESRIYVVESIAIVDPEEVGVLDATPTPTVTLVTCYPFDYIGSAPQRYIVRARLAANQGAEKTGAVVAPEGNPS